MDGRHTRLKAAQVGALLCALAACSDGSSGDADTTMKPSVAAPPARAPVSNVGSTPAPTTPATAGSAAPPVTMTPMTPMGAAGSMGSTMPPTMMMPMAGSSAPAMPVTPRDPSLPDDGDPSKPMVEIPGIKCGVPAAGFGGTPGTVKITNRDVVVAYPCAHEGAAVTFFLFLHGTVDEPIKVSFTMNAWPIHELVDSHNIIVVAPKAVGTQWGNGDNGADLPHLYDVVDWVYATFGEKFDIRSMWAQGGSWGAFYLQSKFACDPKFEGRLKGVQLIVGGGCPTCSNRLSCMVAQEELEKGGGNPLTPEQREMYSNGANIDTYATMHGCDGKMGPTDLGNAKYWVWPNCDQGWIHSYYMGPGNHADAWDRAVVLKATEEIKATEK